MGFFLSNTTIIYILVIISLVLAVLVLRLEFKMRRLLSGKNGGTLENHFVKMQQDLSELHGFKKDTEKQIRHAYHQLGKTVQGVHTVRFNAFEGLDSGGDHSFATALINQNGDGVILSTLHARDRVNVYSKPVQNFKTIQKLTDEETEALTKACESCKV